MNAITLKKTLVGLQVKETALIMSLSVILPFIVHLIPSSSGIPVGARLLPMFYAPFIAVVLFRPHVSLVTALLSPSLNSLLTGMPLPENVFVLTVELVVFSVISYLIHLRFRHFWATAPLAYLAGVLLVSRVSGTIGFFTKIVINSLAGILILLLLNIFLLRFQAEK